ncbi:MAG: malonic semialdehyde reductase [Pararhodobacter sp.]|nr:malonic semialdehyde reductase [Pararhodobacter sp.]
MNAPHIPYPDALGGPALARLFTEARTHNGWLDKPLPADTEQRLYDLVRMGPTSANCSPARFVFVRSREGKERLRPAMSSGNLDKTMAAPLTVIVAHDPSFYEKLPELFPHTDARPWFTTKPGVAGETAFRNGTLQGGYLILAARALGLDCGPMSGFDKEKVKAAFLADKGWEPNFLVNIGYGDPAALHGRLPRLAFDDACAIV